MKILVLQNGISWDTTSKLNYLKDWFKPVVDLEFTIRKSSYTNIPTEPYTDTEGKSYIGINNQWYDTAISNSAKIEGFDCVIFCQSFNDFISFPAMGYSDKRLNGTYRVVVGSDEYDTYNFQGLKYKIFKDRFTEVVRHELCHVLYTIKGIEDRTHYYYSTSHLGKILIELEQIKEKPINLSNTMRYKYFSDKEIVGLKPELVLLLDQAREIAGIPFKLNSGKRTVEQNEKAGGVKDSAHLSGLAVDIACTTDSARYKIISAMQKVGFNRIGIAKTFVHCDIDKTKSPNVIWLYD